MTSSAAFRQRFRRTLLLVVGGRASGEYTAIGHRDLSLSDPIRFSLLGADSADLNMVSDF
jgi:hypothetical protein